LPEPEVLLAGALGEAFGEFGVAVGAVLGVGEGAVSGCLLHAARPKLAAAIRASAGVRAEWMRD
jgi:hypothetical protein